MRNLLFVFAAALFLTAATHAAVVTTVVEDTFTDGDRTNGDDALDVAWWKINEGTAGDQTLTVKTDDGTPGIGSGNALEATHQDVSNVSDRERHPILGNFSGGDVTLSNTGDSITLKFDFRLLDSTGGPPPNFGNLSRDWRFGLFGDGGTPVTGDLLTDGTTNDDQGYFVRMSTGTQNSARLSSEGGTTAETFMSGSDSDNLLTESSFGGITDHLTHSVELTITQNLSGTIDIDFVLDGGTVDEKSMSANHDASPFFTFSEIGIKSQDDELNYIIDNVVVEFAQLLEPVVDAGADDYVWLADATAGADLVGLITNYDPLKSYTYTWSGAGVSFSTPVVVVDPSCPTTATFPGTGAYTLTLESTNSFGSGSDTVTVTVLDPAYTNVQSGDWNLDDGAGTTVTDSSTGPFDHSGTIAEPDWQDGWVGCAGSSLLFVGGAPDSNDVVAFSADTGPSDPNGNLDNIQYGITIAAWVNTVPNGSQRVLIKDDAFELRIQSDGTVRLKIWHERSGFNMTDSDESDLGENLIIADGKWHHVAGTYSAVDEMAKIYVDGILIHEEDDDGLIWLAEPDIDPKVYMGQNYVGGIDDVQLYSYALDSTAIETLAAMGDKIPFVNAGLDEIYQISDIELLTLQGFVGDLDSSPVIKWEVIGGGNPASVDFTNDDDPTTTVKFNRNDPNTFELQLSATDTLPCGSEVVVITDTVTIATVLPTCANVIADGLTLPLDISGPVEGEPDCYVNLYDLAYLANSWLRCNDPENQPLCEWAWE